MKSKSSAKYKLVFALPIFILCLIAFTNEPLSVRTGGTNLLANYQGKSELIGWFLSGASPNSYKTGIDNQISKHGQKSAFIESIVKAPQNFCTLMQTCSDKDFKGKRFKMTGFIKSQGLDTAAMWLRIDDVVKNTDLDFDNMWDRQVIGTKNWTKCEIVFDVPDSKCVVNYGFILRGAGKIWVDNISFEIVSSSTSKTTHILNEVFPSQYQIPKGLLQKPVNLDFEE